MANQRAIISFALPASCLLLGSPAGRRTYYGTYERGAERGGGGAERIVGEEVPTFQHQSRHCSGRWDDQRSGTTTQV